MRIIDKKINEKFEAHKESLHNGHTPNFLKKTLTKLLIYVMKDMSNLAAKSQ